MKVKPTTRAIKEAAHQLRGGGVVAYPTETAYALGALASSRRGVQRIYALKGRPRQKALPVIVASAAMAEHWFRLNNTARALMQRFMPGALTLVVEARRPLACAARDGSIAFRVSSAAIARALSKAINAPITATSANPSGTKPIFSADEIECLWPQLLILDKGRLRKGPMSTIVDVRSEVRLVRAGLIPFKKIKKALKKASSREHSTRR